HAATPRSNGIEGLSKARGCGLRLPDDLERELELARIIGGSRLAGAARRTGAWIAELVDGRHVEAVGQVEGVGDDLQLEAFAERETARKPQIELEEIRCGEGIASEVAVATERRGDTGDRERRAAVGKALCRHAESNAGQEGGGGRAGAD